MKKSIFITISTIFAIILFGVSSFANNGIMSDAANGVRNVVHGTENVIEGATRGITNGIKNGIKNGVSDTENVTKNTMNSMTTTNNNYGATRTATTRAIGTNTNTNTILGMSPLAWSLFILATLGIITVALVWYYGKQNELKYENDEDNY